MEEVTTAKAGLSHKDVLIIILSKIIKNNGTAQMKEIYKAVNTVLGARCQILSEQGKASLRQNVNKNAVDKKYIEPYDKANPGWRITDKGRNYIKELNHSLKENSNGNEMIEEVSSSIIKNKTNSTILANKKNIDYNAQNNKNQEIGEKGEIFVLEYEKSRLRLLGFPDLAEKIVHTSKVEGDGCGYDILSFNEDESERYIEVKTTEGGKDIPLILTKNELSKSIESSNNYYLYRVYNYSENRERIKILIINGDLSELCNDPINFRICIEMNNN